ncbi:MAG: hypothetical protein A2W19_10085 [Spirochaetes bacterium RBG_16_49_21]|nr:MAG: hypothetical protein A2W19_10085 [Spirochaetes bacterium RBG_16_49_21]
MSARLKAFVIGILFLITSVFLYFTIRFKYIERDYITSLISITNDIVRTYYTFEKRTAGKKKEPASRFLSEYIRYIRKKYKDIALLAITDPGLSVRLSSKNDRFIRSADLFEEILKDFTQDRFTISRNNPYIIRYYGEKTGTGTIEYKFYIFVNKIGAFRLLVVYPHHFGKMIIIRTGLELSLILILFIVFTAAAYSAAGRRAASRRKTGHEPGAVPGGLAGPVKALFASIRHVHGADSVSLYIRTGEARLVKAVEIKGNRFFRNASPEARYLDINNAAGEELGKSSILVLDKGTRLLLPLIYNGNFLGIVIVRRRKPIRGDEIHDIRSGMSEIVQHVYDMVSDPDPMYTEKFS